MKNTESTKQTWIYLTGLLVIFIASFSFIFNEKPDLNGDNCMYYMLATALSQGHGYVEIANGSYAPTGVFPPGYPLLIAPLRFFTDSFIPFKLLNGLFLLGSVLLLFQYIRKNKVSDNMAFVASAAVLMNYQVLHFSTMMMTEMSFLFTSVLAFWLVTKLDEKKSFWKDPFFYLLILTLAYNYHIRTQGLALTAAFLAYFLFTRQWKQMIGLGIGFGLCMLPWMIRNKLSGVNQSRYLDQIMMNNAWRPEAGQVDISGIVSRFFDNFQMLITQAIPDSITPYIHPQYGNVTALNWVIAILVWAVIGVGMWKFGKYKWLFFFYALATFGIISIFNAPSENRYVTTLLPFMEICLLIGAYTLLSVAVQKLHIAKEFSPWILLLPVLFFAYPRLEALNQMNKQPFPPAYQNFFAIAKEINKQLPPSTVVCSRKPELYYMYGKTTACGYNWTENDTILIRELIQNKVDFVILEQLGYSSTGRYLYPAIQKNQELFTPVMHLKDPDTYLIRFDKQKASSKFNVEPNH